jgi:hypothetical protein
MPDPDPAVGFAAGVTRHTTDFFALLFFVPKEGLKTFEPLNVEP